ncbi:hypothetical protein E2C01_077208 [Portunus trituberculatus]|uniref:Uncharacterized protein n=1 Tax=Portunus trituberculatus TaxID=210409 RepID=A0A5B7IL87_PORTR|nr:hypothetical protein [Portunus trituberculatus]
MGDLHNNQ